MLRHSLDKSAVELLYLPVPQNIKTPVKSFIDTVVFQVGNAAAGALWLGSHAIFSRPVEQVSLVVMILIPVWLFIVHEIKGQLRAAPSPAVALRPYASPEGRARATARAVAGAGRLVAARPVFILIFCGSIVLLGGRHAQAQSAPDAGEVTGPPAERIIDRDAVEDRAAQAALRPVTWALAPFSLLTRGMEKGLITVEKRRLREKLHYSIQQLNARGFYPQYNGLGDDAGFGGGLLYSRRLFDRDLKMNLTLLGSVKAYQEHALQLEWPGLTSGRDGFALDFRFRSRPGEDFYGLGADSLRGNRSSFFLRQTSAEWGYTRHWSPRWRTGAALGYASTRLSAGRDRATASPESVFDLDRLPGYRSGADLASFKFTLEHDTRSGREEEFLRGSGRERMTVGLVRSVDGTPFEYLTYSALVERYIPVLRERSELALRVQGDFNDPRAGRQAPFFNLARLGGSGSLRGFRENRFFDHNALLLNTEYRYALNSNLEAVLFTDVGQVFNKARDLTRRSLRAAYGFGFRFKTRKGVAMRLEAARGDEGMQWYLKFNSLFGRQRS